MQNRRYEAHGINWMFYLEGEFDDETMTVIVTDDYRLHKGEGTHPDAEKGEFIRVQKDGKEYVKISKFEGPTQVHTYYEVMKGWE